jgi:hypothetical protein
MTLMRLSLPRKAGDVVLVTGLGLVPGETRVLVVAVDGRLFWLSRDKQAEG